MNTDPAEDKELAHKLMESEWQSWAWIQKAWLQSRFAQLLMWDKSCYFSNTRHTFGKLYILSSEFMQVKFKCDIFYCFDLKNDYFVTDFFGY